jgi:O-antigen/teichoic acid export membrane protein
VLLGVAATISIGLAVLATAAGGEFLALAYTEDYAAYRWAFVLVMLAGGFTLVNSVSYFALVASRRPSMQLGVQSLGLLVTAAVGAWSIPSFGVNGAALAIATGAAAMALAGARTLLGGRGRA